MFRITNIKLKNFIGLAKVSNDEGIFEVSFDNSPENTIIMLFGENGVGKTTLLENLTPYSNMLSRETKQSIKFPAFKIIDFFNTKTKEKYTFEIYWNDEKSTKAYVKINDIVIENTKKGNVTEYNYFVEEHFGDFTKFKNSLFLQQGVLDIVKAKPSERINIINNFMQDLNVYNDIKKNSVEKINNLKSVLSAREEDILELESFENRYKSILEFEENYDENTISRLLEELNLLKTQFNDYQTKLISKDNLTKRQKELQFSIDNFTTQDVFPKIDKLNKDIIELEDKIANLNLSSDSQKELQNKQNLVHKNKSLISELSKYNTEYGEFCFKELEDKIIDIIEEGKVARENVEKNSSLLHSFKRFLEVKKSLSNLQTELLEITGQIDKIPVVKLNTEQKLEDVLEDISFTNALINKEEEQTLKILEFEKTIKELKIDVDVIKLEEKKKTLQETVFDFNRISKELKTLQFTLDNKNDSYCEHCGQTIDKDNLCDLVTKKQSFISSFDIENVKQEIENISNEISTFNSNHEKVLFYKSELEKLKLKDRIDLDKLKDKILKLTEIKNHLLDYEKYTESIKPLSNKKSLIEDKISSLKIELEEFKFEENISIDFLKEEDERLNIILNETIKKYNNLNNFISNELFVTVNKDLKISFLTSQLESDCLLLENEIIDLTEKINTSNSLNTSLNNLIKSKDNFKNLISRYDMEKIELENVTSELVKFIDIDNETVLALKIKLDNKTNEYTSESVKIAEYKKDKEHIEQAIKKYNDLKLEVEYLSDQIYVLSKIKNYSDVIKKSSVMDFFNDISVFINKVLSRESGTLNQLKVKIVQTRSTSFDILVENGTTEVKDISLLSGAEQGTVARAIYFALSQFTNFGIIWLDECDGMLSETNKDVFIEMLLTMKDLIGLEQIFLISHNKNIINKSDTVIELNSFL